METISFRSDYPDLDEVCCAQIDQIFPRGSQSRLPDGTIPLSRIAALGYPGLCEAIRLTPVDVRRIAGEMNILASPDDAAREFAGRICGWLEKRGVSVQGWPPPPKTFPATSVFTIMSERGKARTLLEVIRDGDRALYRHEKEWLVGVLSKLARTY